MICLVLGLQIENVDKLISIRKEHCIKKNCNGGCGNDVGADRGHHIKLINMYFKYSKG